MRSAIRIAALFMAAIAAAQPPAAQVGRRAATEQREADMQPLSQDQKQLVKAILAKYSEAAMTPEAARAINEAFRAAGMRRGPSLEQAIADAGFNLRRRVSGGRVRSSAAGHEG